MATDKLIGQEVLDQFNKENPEPADIEPVSGFSRYYSVLDLTYSKHGQNPIVPCTRYGNTFSELEIRENLSLLCSSVLDPIADVFGKQPLTSTYRGPLINSHPQVQGDPNSAHLIGLASDVQPPRAAEVLAFLAKNWEVFHLDRVIMEERKGREGKTRWLHIQRLPKDKAATKKGLWLHSPVAGVYEKSRVEDLMTYILQNSRKVQA
jgi:hypothetical protein